MSGEWCKMSGEWCVPFDFAAGATTRPPLNLHPTGTLPRVHPVLLQALRTAPETKSALQVQQALRLPGNLHDRQPRASGDHASTQSSCSSVYCACHEICTPGSPSAVPATKSARQAAKCQRLTTKSTPSPPAGSAYCPCHEICMHSRFTKCCACHEIYTTGSRGPVATTRPPNPHCRLCVLRLPRNLHFRFTKCCACGEISTPGSPSAVPATKST